eukprot:UN05427
MNFAKNTGIIIELSNKYFAGGYLYARYYDVSWLSKYAEEDERLWVGGNAQIQIRGIRNTATLQNFSKFFRALFWFDAGLSGANFYDVLGSKVHFSQKDKKFVCSLIDFALGYTSDFACPKYIKDTFHSFCINKKTISLFMQILVDLDIGEIFKHTLFDSCGALYRHGASFYNKDKDKQIPLKENIKIDNWDFNSSKNLLKTKIFNLFPNLTNIVIQSGDQWGNRAYSFSLVKFMKILHGLPSIQRKNQMQCTINAIGWEYHD